MRTQTPLAPREPFDVTVHMVLNDFGQLGRAYVETGEAEADEPPSKIFSMGSTRIRCGWLPSIQPKAGRVTSPRRWPVPYSTTRVAKIARLEKPHSSGWMCRRTIELLNATAPSPNPGTAHRMGHSY